jgi:hypothetical protein
VYFMNANSGYKRSRILRRIEGIVSDGIALWYYVILCAICVLCDPLCTFVDQIL